jgi:hypothetical protein
VVTVCLHVLYVAGPRDGVDGRFDRDVGRRAARGNQKPHGDFTANNLNKLSPPIMLRVSDHDAVDRYVT